MIRRVLTAALLAGLIAGLAVSAVQRLAIVPLIFQAEALEAPAAVGHDHGHEPGAGPWAPADGLERTAWTVAANVLTGVAFALILAAGIVLRGGAVDGRRGVAWGLAGFACFALLPGLGLPPAPPGMAEGVLADRQVWWLATAVLSAGGLALIVFGRALVWRVAGVVLLATPHAVGAPLPDGTGGLFARMAEGGLPATFALASLGTTLVFWLVLGAVTGRLLRDPLAREAAGDPRWA